MEKETPYLVLYGRTYDEAMEIVYRRQLRNCEPASDRLIGIWFSEVPDLILFKLKFHDEAIFYNSDCMAVLHVQHDDMVSEFVEDYGLSERIERFDLLGVWFRCAADEMVMNKEFGISP
jgi:hypothetical protein